MKAEIEKARLDADSVGGIIECAVTGVKAGFGEPMFEGIENRLAAAVFGIPAVKGIEFGRGFSSALLRGSEITMNLLYRTVQCEPKLIITAEFSAV